MLFINSAGAEIYRSDEPSVHEITVNVGGTCCAEFYMSTKVGHLVNNSCQYSSETPPQRVTACSVKPFGVFTLNGQELENIIGNQWDCAATHIKSMSSDKEGLDAFALLKNEQGHYVNSNPSAGTIYLPICLQ